MPAPASPFRALCTAAGLLAAAGPAAAAPLPGALETFPDEINAEAWTVYDYADGKYYLPQWFDGDDPFAGLAHDGDAPLYFFADAAVAGGAFVGDFAGAGILGIGVDLFIDRDFDYLDCVVYTDGPLGLDWYFSSAVFGSDHPGGGWVQADFWLDETWYYWDPYAGEYVPFVPDTIFLANIREVGFEFFPQPGTTRLNVAALDNVALIPTVVAPRLDGRLANGRFTLRFTPAPGTECDLERHQPAPAEPWQVVAGQAAITGPATHQFTTPLNEPRAMFRVRAYEHYTEVLTAE